MHIMRNPHTVPLKYACQTCTVGIKVALRFQSGPLWCFAKCKNRREELITNILPSLLWGNHHYTGIRIQSNTKYFYTQKRETDWLLHLQKSTL